MAANRFLESGLESQSSLASELTKPGGRAKRVLGLIDSLGSGGAQRQFIYLMRWLRQAGYEVFVITYHPNTFFAGDLSALGIRWEVESGPTKAALIRNIHRRARVFQPDVIISFLDAPNAIAELVGCAARVPVIASERSFDVGGWSLRLFRRLVLHGLACRVVTNSRAQAAVVGRCGPWLKRRLRTISNCVDVTRFRPVGGGQATQKINMAVVASFSRHKNPMGVLQAFAAARRSRPDLDWSLDWYGAKLYRDAGGLRDSSSYDGLKAAIATAGLEACFRLHEPVQDVQAVLNAASAVCLASYYEGCPNIVCEAMACGRPVLASRVSDIPWLLEPQPPELLFNPEFPEDIGRAMLAFAGLGVQAREAIGARNRERAEADLAIDAYGRKFAALIEECGC